ncbi:MAG: gamma-glutamyl-gamma-aminobutyrate hydrolase family protein [Cellulosilyticaceae bacterium]
MKQIKQKIGIAIIFATILLSLVIGQLIKISVEKSVSSARIGIAWLEEGEPSNETQANIDAIILAGGEPVLLPKVENMEQAKDVLTTVEAVVMTGGEDVDPCYYGDDNYELLGDINEERDISDYWMIRAALEEDVPMLAICRGMQMLNIVCGGDVYKDIPSQYESALLHREINPVDFSYHEIEVYEGNKFSDLIGAGTHTVNSLHHQAIQKIGKNLIVTAMSSDGIIEGLEYTEASYAIGTQFHPEEHIAKGEESFLPFFEQLVLSATKTE